MVYSLLEKGLLGNYNYYPSTGNPYNFSRAFFTTAATALILGLLIGTIEILFFNKLFLRMSFLKKIIYKTIIYIAIFISFLLIITTIYNAVQLKTNVLNKSVWDNVWGIFLKFRLLEC
jgi:adenylate cyclase